MFELKYRIRFADARIRDTLDDMISSKDLQSGFNETNVWCLAFAKLPLKNCKLLFYPGWLRSNVGSGKTPAFFPCINLCFEKIEWV